MFNKELKRKIKIMDQEISGLLKIIELVDKKLDTKLREIEKKLNPAKFKRGDLVTFFLADKELAGEVISEDTTTEGYKYEVCYLDKNDVIQRATVNEEYLFFLNENDIYERLADLECQVDFLANELNKLKKK